jgi:adenylosuccinate synthase
VKILQREIQLTGIDEKHLLIDPFAVLITQEDLDKEAANGLKEAIGSTGSGTGSAISRRVNRNKDLLFAKDEPALAKYIKNTKLFLRNLLEENERIIIEGTQGFGLSLLHSECYPFITSRDTSAAAFVAEAGLSPLDVDDVIMVIRSFPIRVGGNSGPLPTEIDWETVTATSGSKENLIEFTSVTKRVRRVAEFHSEVVKRAIEVNNPTRIVLNHIDYFDINCAETFISQKALEEIEKIEFAIERRIDFLGSDRITNYERKNTTSYEGNTTTNFKLVFSDVNQDIFTY